MKALIIDDHPLFAEGMKLLLLAATSVSQAHWVTDGEQGLQWAHEQVPQLVFLDLFLERGQSGLPLIRTFCDQLPGARVVVVSGQSDPKTVEEALESGAAGFVPKSSTPARMIDTLRLVVGGGVSVPLDPGQSGFDDGTFPAGPETGTRPQTVSLAEAFPELTPRQQEVLAALARGLPNKVIARELGLAEGTVKQHLHAIYGVIGAENRAGALYRMARAGVSV